MDWDSIWHPTRPGYESRDRLIADEFQRGVPVSEIMTRYGLRHKRVYAIASRMQARRPPRAVQALIHGESIKEICLINRDRLSAAAIAAALGITRNAVIGHWYRARQAAAPSIAPERAAEIRSGIG